MKRTRITRALTLVALIAAVALCAGAVAQSPLQSNHPRLSEPGTAFLHGHLQVNQGTDGAAKTYYKTVVAPEMNFMKADTITNSTINDLLDYFGYKDILRAQDLHAMTSDQLMAKAPKAEDILATKFFAPKITEVKTPPPEVQEKFGWRKLIRLKSLQNSAADKAGMDKLDILQNFIEAADKKPFTPGSVALFNQAMVTRKIGTGPYDDKKRASFFFAYGPLVRCADTDGKEKDCDGKLEPLWNGEKFKDDGKLAYKLQATFDARRNPETGAAGDYYVPDSCVQCHGRNSNKSKVNYLDTDHWFDRVDPIYGVMEGPNPERFNNEDFTALKKLELPVLPDGGLDPTSTTFSKAFDVIRKLNREIRAQNEEVAGPKDFATLAVSKWLELHSVNQDKPNRHVPPYDRGIGENSWNSNSPDDERKLIYYLNRYCFRCHSSIKFDVFDRQGVWSRKKVIIDRVKSHESNRWMPQDRAFPGLETNQIDLREFLDLLEKLPN